MSKKDFSALVKEAEGQGWRVQRTKKGHWRLLAPDGVGIVIAAGTPSDRRGFDNTVASMRRYGFIWKGH
jgi:hypothetical protein